MNVINSGDSHWAELVKPYFLTVSNLLDSDPNPLKWVEFFFLKKTCSVFFVEGLWYFDKFSLSSLLIFNVRDYLKKTVVKRNMQTKPTTQNTSFGQIPAI